MSVMAVLLWATAAYAQKPNFSGKWTVDAEKTAAANPNAMAGGGGGGGRGGGRGGGGGDMTVTQDATSLKVERTMGQATMASTYKLDGSESKNSQPGRNGGDPTDVISHAKWVGNTIEIVTTGANGDTKAVWSMDGADLKVATTRPGRNGGEATTSTQVYKKG